MYDQLSHIQILLVNISNYDGYYIYMNEQYFHVNDPTISALFQQTFVSVVLNHALFCVISGPSRVKTHVVDMF